MLISGQTSYLLEGEVLNIMGSQHGLPMMHQTPSQAGVPGNTDRTLHRRSEFVYDLETVEHIHTSMKELKGHQVQSTRGQQVHLSQHQQVGLTREHQVHLASGHQVHLQGAICHEAQLTSGHQGHLPEGQGHQVHSVQQPVHLVTSHSQSLSQQTPQVPQAMQVEGTGTQWHQYRDTRLSTSSSQLSQQSAGQLWGHQVQGSEHPGQSAHLTQPEGPMPCSNTQKSTLYQRRISRTEYAHVSPHTETVHYTSAQHGHSHGAEQVVYTQSQQYGQYPQEAQRGQYPQEAQGQIQGVLMAARVQQDAQAPLQASPQTQGHVQGEHPSRVQQQTECHYTGQQGHEPYQPHPGQDVSMSHPPPHPSSHPSTHYSTPHPTPHPHAAETNIPFRTLQQEPQTVISPLMGSPIGISQGIPPQMGSPRGISPQLGSPRGVSQGISPPVGSPRGVSPPNGSSQGYPHAMGNPQGILPPKAIPQGITQHTGGPHVFPRPQRTPQGQSQPRGSAQGMPTSTGNPQMMAQSHGSPRGSPKGNPMLQEVLPEQVNSPISYVSEWLRSSNVWGEGGYGTPTTADLERDSSRFVYPPPSKLLTDSTPQGQPRTGMVPEDMVSEPAPADETYSSQHVSQCLYQTQTNTSNLQTELIQQTEQSPSLREPYFEHDPSSTDIEPQPTHPYTKEGSTSQPPNGLDTEPHASSQTASPSDLGTDLRKYIRHDTGHSQDGHCTVTGANGQSNVPQHGGANESQTMGGANQTSISGTRVYLTPQITLDTCEPMTGPLLDTEQEPMGSRLTEGLRCSPGGQAGINTGSPSQQLPVRNLKISSPKSTQAARRASSPVVCKPSVPFFWHFKSNKNNGGSGVLHDNGTAALIVKDSMRRFSDSNIPMEAEDLRVKPAIRSKSTGDSSYEDEHRTNKSQDPNFLSVGECKQRSVSDPQGSRTGTVSVRDKSPPKALKLKTFFTHRYEAEEEEGESLPQTEGDFPESQSEALDESETPTQIEAEDLSSKSHRPIDEPETSAVSTSFETGAQKKQTSPEKTHVTRAVESWSGQHPISIKVEPMSPYISDIDDPETPGSVFTPGINVPATPTSFLASGPRSSSLLNKQRQIFSFNVPHAVAQSGIHDTQGQGQRSSDREMSPPDRIPPRRPLVPIFQRKEKSLSTGAPVALNIPRPGLVMEGSSSSSVIEPRHHSDPSIYMPRSAICKMEESVPGMSLLDTKPTQVQLMDTRSPPGGRKHPPPPLQLAAEVSAFRVSPEHDMGVRGPLPSPAKSAPLQSPSITSVRMGFPPSTAYLAGGSAPATGLRSPAFPFTPLPPGHPLQSLSLMSPHLPWSAPPTANLMSHPSPGLLSRDSPIMMQTSPNGGARMGPMSPALRLPHQHHINPAPIPPSSGPGSNIIVAPPDPNTKQQDLSKLTLTSMAAVQQLREQHLRDGSPLRDPNLTYMCPVCAQLFPSYNYLANHMVNHLPSETVNKGPGENKLHLCKVR